MSDIRDVLSSNIQSPNIGEEIKASGLSASKLPHSDRVKGDYSSGAHQLSSLASRNAKDVKVPSSLMGRIKKFLNKKEEFDPRDRADVVRRQVCYCRGMRAANTLKALSNPIDLLAAPVAYKQGFKSAGAGDENRAEMSKPLMSQMAGRGKLGKLTKVLAIALPIVLTVVALATPVGPAVAGALLITAAAFTLARTSANWAQDMSMIHARYQMGKISVGEALKEALMPTLKAVAISTLALLPIAAAAGEGGAALANVLGSGVGSSVTSSAESVFGSLVGWLGSQGRSAAEIAGMGIGLMATLQLKRELGIYVWNPVVDAFTNRGDESDLDNNPDVNPDYAFSSPKRYLIAQDLNLLPERFANARKDQPTGDYYYNPNVLISGNHWNGGGFG